MNLTNLVERVKGIILAPKKEWSVIEAEPSSIQDIYRNYIVILAALPAVANFLGNWLFGFSRGSEGIVHTTFFGGLFRSLVQYGLTLPLIYAVALVISRLAPSFDGKTDDLRALKLVAYSYTPVWVAEIFSLVPPLRWLDFLGLYGVYVFYVGVARLTRSREEYSDVYTAAAVFVALVAAFLHGAIAHLIVPLSSVTV